MDIFDNTIKQIKEWFNQKENEGNVWQYFAPTSAQKIRTHSQNINQAGTNPPLILKEDTCLELGHPSVGSCSMTLATHNPSLVENGRITLVGPDISAMKTPKVPFAQLVIVCCQGDIGDTSSKMDRELHLFVQSDGYMIRSMPNLIWARVSKDAVRSGFSIKKLGSRILDSLSFEFQDITKAEVFFVTSSREDVSALNDIVEAARGRLRKLLAFNVADDGTYECTSSLDCDECPEQPVCDSIREVIKIRKGDRIITFGQDAVSETN